MNENERANRKYKKGSTVVFRLLKKLKYSDAVLDLLNKAKEDGKLNHEIIRALEFYAKYKDLSSFDDIITLIKKETNVSKTVNDESIDDEILSVDEYENESSKVIYKEIEIPKKDIDEQEELFDSKIIKVDWKQNIKDESKDQIYDAADELFDTNEKNTESPKSGLAKAFNTISRR